MSKYRNNKIILKYLKTTLIDSKFDLKYLLVNKYFNFHFEDNYGFGEYPNKGLIRKKIIQLLFEIHDKWKIELDKLNKPYYLAIWLCEPLIIRSEIVCAIDERIELYSNNFLDKSDNVKSIKKESYGKSKNQIERFNWERKNLYEIHGNVDYNWPKNNYKNVADYYKNKRYYKRILKKCSKVLNDKYGKVYYQKIGDVWVGKEKIE